MKLWNSTRWICRCFSIRDLLLNTYLFRFGTTGNETIKPAFFTDKSSSALGFRWLMITPRFTLFEWLIRLMLLWICHFLRMHFFGKLVNWRYSFGQVFSSHIYDIVSTYHQLRRNVVQSRRLSCFTYGIAATSSSSQTVDCPCFLAVSDWLTLWTCLFEVHNFKGHCSTLSISSWPFPFLSASYRSWNWNLISFLWCYMLALSRFYCLFHIFLRSNPPCKLLFSSCLSYVPLDTLRCII